MNDNNAKPPLGSWDQWANYVLKEMKRLNELYEKLDLKLDQLQVRLVQMETKFNLKSGIWGAIAGLIPASIALIYWLLTTR